MNRLLLLVLAVAAIGAGGVFALVRSRANRPLDPDAESHRVTTEMLTTSDALASRPAPAFRLRGTDGATYDLDDLARQGPVALVFIKDGCPCSSDAQPYFNRLHAAYGREVRFLGVIDVEADRGRAWGQKNGTTFPLVADPGLSAIHAYRVESSAYLAIVARGGAIDHVYPGYSASMLAEASERLARLAGVAPRPIDAAGAPGDLITGCPF